MAAANSSGVRTRADHVVASFSQSATVQDSDPNVEEALRRAREQRTALAPLPKRTPGVALRDQLAEDAARRVRDHGAAIREGLAAYRAYAADAAA